MSLGTCQIGATDRYARDRHRIARDSTPLAVNLVPPWPALSRHRLVLHDGSFVGFHQFRDLSLETFGLGFQPGNLGGDHFGQIGSEFV